MIRLALEQPQRGSSGAILARTKLRALSTRLGYSPVKGERMELVCAELVTNQAKYAGGTGMIQIWETLGPCPSVDLFAYDFGPGIPDLERAIVDGYTTEGTLGRGLGAIQRLADESAFYSLTGGEWHGLSVWARFYPGDSPCGLAAGCRAGVYLRAYQDRPDNGDSIRAFCDGDSLHWLHLDALGHGREAARAIAATADCMNSAIEPVERLAAVDRCLVGIRGGVGIAGRYRRETGAVAICGVGDMSASCFDEQGGGQRIAFAPGILGHEYRTPVTNNFQLLAPRVVVTTSDGIRGRWQEHTFPGLWHQHPQLIAFTLGNLLGRANDDRSVFVLRSDTKGARQQ